MPPERKHNAFLRSYVLLFERREAPSYSAATGFALLVVFLVLEYVIGPRAGILAWMGVAQPPSWARIVGLSAIAIFAAFLARAKPTDIGLLPLSRWTNVEAFYLAQVVLIATSVFVLLNLPALRAQSAAGLLFVSFSAAVEIGWGFYQELIYRGILQTEIVRRFGAIAGIVIANAAFVFGPLHFYVLTGAASLQDKAIFFAATFATGLIFGYIFLRTRNAVLVGIMHGVGDAIANVPHAFHQAH